jgi:methionine synthase I (cobalamin-dependent)
MTKIDFLNLLNSRPWLLADGATGTNYFQMGLTSGDAPELWNFDHPDRVRTLHRRFIEAGADIILTNSFGGNRYRLKLHNFQDRAREVNLAAARNARAEADAAQRPVVVAGSMGPTGEIFQPVGTLATEDGASAFAEQAAALKEGGADVLWIETMSSEEELRAAVEGASSAGLPIVTTMSFDTNGRTMMGITPAAFAELTKSLAAKPAAIGANCGVGASELVATILGITAARPESMAISTMMALRNSWRTMPGLCSMQAPASSAVAAARRLSIWLPCVLHWLIISAVSVPQSISSSGGLGPCPLWRRVTMPPLSPAPGASVVEVGNERNQVSHSQLPINASSHKPGPR